MPKVPENAIDIEQSYFFPLKNSFHLYMPIFKQIINL